jgi:hypothetical protein
LSHAPVTLLECRPARKNRILECGEGSLFKVSVEEPVNAVKSKGVAGMSGAGENRFALQAGVSGKLRAKEAGLR